MTLRTGKKYKKYIKNETKQFRGIENRANGNIFCYIFYRVLHYFCRTGVVLHPITTKTRRQLSRPNP